MTTTTKQNMSRQKTSRHSLRSALALRCLERPIEFMFDAKELISRGYSGAHDKPLRADGVYRLEMQPAVLAFQQDHGLAQTGDIDRSTLLIALPLSRNQTIDRMDHVERSRAPFTPAPSSDAPVRGFQPGPDDYLRHPTRHDPEFQRLESSAAITSEPPARSDPRNHRHPDHALYDALRQRLPPQIPDDTVAHVMLQAKIGGVRNADELDKVIVQDGRAFVMGTTPGFRTAVDLSQIPPPMQETTQRSEALDQQHAMQRDQWLAQDQAQSRGMHRSL